jgi:hypothetical protein
MSWRHRNSDPCNISLAQRCNHICIIIHVKEMWDWNNCRRIASINKTLDNCLHKTWCCSPGHDCCIFLVHWNVESRNHLRRLQQKESCGMWPFLMFIAQTVNTYWESNDHLVQLHEINGYCGDRESASQNIPRLSWNRKVQYIFRRSSPLNRILSQINPINSHHIYIRPTERIGVADTLQTYLVFHSYLGSDTG